MRVVILQPSYLPWLGYFDQLHRSDVFVLYDDVQYDKNGWRNRNRIKTPLGWQWLTVPVQVKGLETRICDVEIDNRQRWAVKHLRALQIHYQKSPYFDSYIRSFEEIYRQTWRHLEDLDAALLHRISEFLGIRRKVVLAKDLNIGGAQTERLVNICGHLRADTYLTGDSARNYLDTKLFKEAGIELEYQNYAHPVYPQLYGEFIPHLSVVDLLFNCGPDSLAVLTREKR